MSDHVSAELFARAANVIPGGVNSPVRAFRAVGGTPVFIRSAEGAELIGADGTRYVDFVCSWGPIILGHADPGVLRAIHEAADHGTTFGAPTEGEIRLAEEIAAAMPGIEMVRLTSSGTEAAMGALRLARGATGRSRVIKMDGCYHGGADYLLVRAGSGAATLGQPDSAGVPPAFAELTTVVPFNDSDALRRALEQGGSDVAAVIVEPVVGNMGVVPPSEGYLAKVRELTQRAGALFVVDEVMTGFRLARGGAQERFGVQADITVLGKVVGGGMPLAAYGASRKLMQHVAPLGPVYQAGTLSGNPVAVAAGLATLERLRDKSTYERLERIGARLEDMLTECVRTAGVEACIQRVGSMLTIFFCKGPVRSFDDARVADTAAFARFHQTLLARGVYWPCSQFEAAFMCLAHEDILEGAKGTNLRAAFAAALKASRSA